MRGVKTALATLSAALLAACSHAPAAGTRAGLVPADLFPLAVGNRWTYVDRSPGLPAGQPPPVRTVRIVERTADGFFRDNERGELRADGDCVRDRVRRLVCRPVETGTSWVSVTGVSATERYEIAAVGERVETPAGTFSGCVRVRAHVRAGPGAENILELTYAPGVGPVRIETYSVVEGKMAPQVRADLESYSLAR
jgi:hypothetical protein